MSGKVTKIGATAAFGALMLAAGLFMPGSVRLSVASFIHGWAPASIDRKLQSALGAPASVATHSSTQSATATASPASASSPAPSAEPAAAGAGPVTAGTPKSPPPIPYKDLLVPTPQPETGVYALQIGLFPTEAAADAAGRRFRLAGIPTDVLQIIDTDGEEWKLVSAGKYSSAESARDARLSLARGLDLVQALPVILLPAKAPSSQGSSDSHSAQSSP